VVDQCTMERWVAKVISIVVTLLVPMVCTMIPYPMAGYVERKGKIGELVICRVMCFGGGIFFGTFLLHVAPEVSGRKDLLLKCILPIGKLLYAIHCSLL